MSKGQRVHGPLKGPKVFKRAEKGPIHKLKVVVHVVVFQLGSWRRKGTGVGRWSVFQEAHGSKQKNEANEQRNDGNEQSDETSPFDPLLGVQTGVA